MTQLDLLLKDLFTLANAIDVEADLFADPTPTKTAKSDKAKPEEKPLMINGQVVPIKGVYPNHNKNAYTVVWNDNSHTTIHLHEEDEWDEEKALAMCFVKHFYSDTGAYNEIFKKYCHSQD